MKIVRWVGAVCFVLSFSASARAQINPQYQISLPAGGSEMQATTLSDFSQPAAESSDQENAPAQDTASSKWPAGAPTKDAYGTPYDHVSQVYYHEWSWESGVYAGGGTGLGSSHTTQFFVVGFHVGKVLTRDHFPGFIHGNFEFGGEFIPVYELFTINQQNAPQNVYGVSVKPVILRWNLVSWDRFVPFFQLAGGFVITNSPVPPGPTSRFNFTPQGGFGFNIFTKPGQAVKTEFIFGHISSASLGTTNPGYNSLFIFELGYEWLHGWRHH